MGETYAKQVNLLFPFTLSRVFFPPRLVRNMTLIHSCALRFFYLTPEFSHLLNTCILVTYVTLCLSYVYTICMILFSDPLSLSLSLSLQYWHNFKDFNFNLTSSFSQPCIMFSLMFKAKQKSIKYTYLVYKFRIYSKCLHGGSCSFRHQMDFVRLSCVMLIQKPLVRYTAPSQRLSASIHYLPSNLTPQNIHHSFIFA